MRQMVAMLYDQKDENRKCKIEVSASKLQLRISKLDGNKNPTDSKEKSYLHVCHWMLNELYSLSCLCETRYIKTTGNFKVQL